MINKTLNDFINICVLLNLNKIKYCVIRIPTEDRGNDFEIDILINKSYVDNLRTLLPYPEFSYCMDGNDTHHHFRRNEIHLDFTTSLSYGKNGEYTIGDIDNVINRAILKDDIYFACSIDEFQMLLLHSLFNKRSFTKHSGKIFNLMDTIGEEICIKMMSKILS